MSKIYQYKYKCYKCEKDNSLTDKYVYVFKTNSKQKYQAHCLEHGTGWPCYPGLADIELYGLIAQGKEWEKPVDRSEDIQNYVDNGDKKSKLVAQVERSRRATEVVSRSESTMPILPKINYWPGTAGIKEVKARN